MPRLGDFTKAVRRVGLWRFANRVWDEVSDDNLFAWAAAIAYAWLFAIFPFLVFTVALLPHLPQHVKDGVESQLPQIVEEYVPAQYRQSTISTINDLLRRPRAALLSIGLIITLWGASGGMNVTITALEKCYEIDRGRPFYKKRPIAIALTAVVAILILTLVVLLPVGTLVIKWIQANGITYITTPVLWTWRIIRYPISVLLMFLTVNVLYYYGPAIRQRFRFFTPGSVFVVGVWLIFAFLFRLYVEKFASNNETFRALGGVAILLLFFYLDALVLLIGAEINSEIDYEVLGVQRGSRDFRSPANAPPVGEKPLDS